MQDNNDVASVGHFRKRNGIQVVWLLGNICTYKCTYCSSTFNGGDQAYHPYEQVLSVLNSLPNDSSVFFSGGEPTYHPDFEKILDAKPDGVELSVISNASRPYAFWERAVPKLAHIILTYHAEFANLERFIETAKLCREKLDRINLTMIPWKWNECITAYNSLVAWGFPVTPKPLVKDFGFKSSALIDEYSNDEINWINEKNKIQNRGYIGFYRQDGTPIKFSTPSEMLVTGENNFNGWECYTPSSSMYIDPDGNIHDTACQQRRLIGTVATGFKMASASIICKQDFCWCHPDMEGTKVKQL